MEQREPGAVLDLLRRRAPMLRELVAAPASKATLQAALGVSRSTVDRGVRALESKEFVERVPEGYRATLCGRFALDAYDEFESQLSSVCAVSDLLSTLPADVSLAPAAVVGAEVVRPDSTAPQRPVEAFCDLVEWAEGTRGTVVGVSDQFVDVYRRAIADGSAVSLVFPSPSLQRLLSRHPGVVEESLATSRVTLRESPETPEFGFTIHRRDDRQVVGIALHGDDGLRAFVRNDHPEAVRWAESLFESVWSDADPMPVS